MKRLAIVLLSSSFLCLIDPSQITAGTYSHVVICEKDTGCFPGTPITQPDICAPDCRVSEISKTHPIGYDGDSDPLQIKICVAAGSEEMIGPTDRAIATWNNLAPTTNNCQMPPLFGPEGCSVWEDNLPTPGAYHAESVILHELGHCAMGLAHTDRFWRLDWPAGDFKGTSFTASFGALIVEDALDPGDDTIPGSNDDFHTAPTGGLPAKAAGWYRRGLNEPWIVNATTIDRFSYTRSVTSPTGLPPGHTWAANANREVSKQTLPSIGPGYDTHAVMYSREVSHQQFSGLSADDVNMVKFTRTGKDREFNTPDDYTVELVRVASCLDSHDILLTKQTLASGVIADCRTPGVDYSYSGQNPSAPQHFTLQSFAPEFEPLFVVMNQALGWDTDPPNSIFADGLESGVHPWSLVVP